MLEWWEIGLWLAALSMLGVFMAIPLKRQLINIDQLPFPSGIATAETLTSMHSEGGEAVVKARSLFGAAILGAILYFAVTAITGYEIGLVAIAVGWLVGRAIQKGTGGRPIRFRIRMSMWWLWFSGEWATQEWQRKGRGTTPCRWVGS